MNSYDRLPPLFKLLHLALLLAPLAAAWLLTQSWRAVAVTFFLGTLLLGWVFAWASGRIVRALTAQSGDEDLDAHHFHRAFVWPFLLSGPIAGAIVAFLVAA